jgi:hypothetical protein
MKTLYHILLFILSLSLLASSCKKHIVKPVNQLSLLPPATQTGANTFGCLVNGQAFTPNGNVFSGPEIQCNYIHTAGGYHLTVAADNKINSNLIKGVLVGTDSLAITQGQTYSLKSFVAGNAMAWYKIFYQIGEDDYETTNSVLGQLTITKFDPTKEIVSGTFYFNAVNVSGDTVKVTDGRFDMQYTM